MPEAHCRKCPFIGIGDTQAAARVDLTAHLRRVHVQGHPNEVSLLRWSS